MKRLLIISLLMTNIVMYPITEKGRQLSTALVFAAGAGIAGMSKEGAPLIMGLVAAGVTYGWMYQFTPTARLNKAEKTLEDCAGNDLIRLSFKNQCTDTKDTIAFWNTLNRAYCKKDLLLIAAAKDLVNSMENIECAKQLMEQAEKDIHPKNNENPLHPRHIKLWKTYFDFNENAQEALVLIKNHDKYESQLALDNQLNTTQRQTAAKEKIADAQEIKAKAHTKTADATESSVFLEWLKWIISFLSKK